MKIIYCLMVLLCPALCVAQTADGEVVPDILFANMYNHPKPTASLYNFKSKLLIVEFWAGYCTACIHKFPLLDSMQQQYPDDLKVLLISVSPLDKVAGIDRIFKNIKSQHPGFKGLTVVLQDSIAKSYFKPQFIPRYIWMDENFKVIAITSADYITAEKISGYLKGKRFEFDKQEQMDQFDPEEYLFANGNAGNGENILARSTLSRFIPGLGSRSDIHYNKVHKVTKIVFTNEPVSRLLMAAYGFYDRPERLRFMPEDSSLQIMDRSDEWFIANSYTYELITPPIPLDSARVTMQQDLRHYLNVSASIDTVPTSCYLLEWVEKNRQKKKILKIKTTTSMKLGEDGNRHITNATLGQIAEMLDSKMDKHVLTEQRTNMLFNLELPDVKNLTELNLALKKYGLHLKIAERALPNLSIHKIQN